MNAREPIAALGPEHAARLERTLHEFHGRSQARCALLLDRAGRVLATAGTLDFDPVTFASLAAADFAASGQLAVLLGEEDFTSLHHQGEQRSLYMADVDGHAILVALLDAHAPPGLVRLEARTTVQSLAATLADAAARPAPAPELHPAWADAAAHAIDRLFAE